MSIMQITIVGLMLLALVAFLTEPAVNLYRPHKGNDGWTFVVNTKTGVIKNWCRITPPDDNPVLRCYGGKP